MEIMQSNNLKSKNTISTLPEEIQIIFNGNMVSNSVSAMQEIHQLTDEQTKELENEITLTLLGLDFVSTFESRVKSALQITDEKVVDILEDVAGMLFNPETMAILNEMEKMAIKSNLNTNQTQIPIPPNLPTEDKEEIETEPEKNETSTKPTAVSGTNPAPTGKMVGIVKEETESTIKGMRTMRGDINRLRGPEDEGESGSNFTKPFKGK